MANALTQLGESVTCFTFSSKPVDALYNHVQIASKFTNKFIKLFETGIRFATINTTSFDIVHYHGDDYLCIGSSKRVRTFYGSAFYEFLYAVTVTRKVRQFLFYILELLSCLKKGNAVGISKTTCKVLCNVNSVISCCVPLSTFVPSHTKTDYPSILFIGDLYSRKRGKLLIEQFTSHVLLQLPTAILTVIGPKKCSGRGILYKGQLDEQTLIQEYQKSWIYCCPSSYEGFGVPISEAMACKTAVVACDNPGIREIVLNNENGIICKPAMLGTSLLYLLLNKDTRIHLINNAFNHVKQFDSVLIAQLYQKLYESVVMRKPSKL